ncbi:MAG: hypothetical protein F6K53_38105, partial [Moorea sp. SIO4A1]|uniref:hypothetical protein n=1 Tax=Moorena sp. SIO4A1 TaxID=2607835 RepID=UPI00144C38EC
SRFPISDSRFPIPDSRFTIPDSRFPIPFAKHLHNSEFNEFYLNVLKLAGFTDKIPLAIKISHHVEIDKYIFKLSANAYLKILLRKNSHD